MKTWADVQSHLGTKYAEHISVVNPNLLALDFPCSGGRAQRILISTFEAMGKGWVLFRSRVCERSRIDPEEALRRNSGFAVGFLAIAEDFYELVYTTQLNTLDLDELELPIHVLTDTADQLEREFTGGDRW